MQCFKGGRDISIPNDSTKFLTACIGRTCKQNTMLLSMFCQAIIECFLIKIRVCQRNLLTITYIVNQIIKLKWIDFRFCSIQPISLSSFEFDRHKSADGSIVGNTVKEPLENFDRRELLPFVADTLKSGASVELCTVVHNADRTVGTELSGEVDEHFGVKGLPEDTIKIHLQGVAGQSFGAFLAPGITLDLQGEANDFMGKGLSGGKIIVRPPSNASFRAEDNVIAGNVIGYGGTSGKIFINGLAGERFGIRNSGMLLVSEGVGDHGCEYMTGGRVVVLGRVGVNFAAGMTGGFAYVYDETGHFDLSCNVDSADLESVLPGTESESELLDIINQHVEATGSEKGKRILENWNSERPKFVKIFPVDYRNALAKKGRA